MSVPSLHLSSAPVSHPPSSRTRSRAPSPARAATLVHFPASPLRSSSRRFERLSRAEYGPWPEGRCRDRRRSLGEGPSRGRARARRAQGDEALSLQGPG